MFVGGKNASFINKSKKSYVIEDFIVNVHTAYITTAEYRQKKLPFNNPLLRYILVPLTRRCEVIRFV